ncbi:hypothetical protein BGZ65_002603, partial [Modicella reniformis]
HVFCKVCLEKYIDGQQVQQSRVSSAAQAQLSQTTREIERASNETTTVECPECNRVQEPTGPLRISSFRTAKFVEGSIDSDGAENADDSHASEHGNLQQEPPSPPQSSPPVGPQDLHQHQYQDEIHCQDQGHHDTDMDEQYAEAFHTPDLSCVPEDILDKPEVSGHPPRPEKAEGSFDQDAFSGLLEDLEMGDIAISPAHTSLPEHRAGSLGHAGNVPAPLLQPSTRRRRLIVDEEDFDKGDEDLPENSGTESGMVQQLQSELDVRPVEVPPKVHHDPNILNDDQYLGRKHRVLVDITPLMPTRLENTSDTGSAIVTQEGSNRPGQCMSLPEEQQPAPQDQRESTQQRSSSQSMSNLSQSPNKRRMLQFHGPWPRQVQQKTGVRFQESSVISITDIISPASAAATPRSRPQSPALSPAPPARPGAPRARLAGFFTLTQPASLYTAEPSAYLPLLVHVPRKYFGDKLEPDI